MILLTIILVLLFLGVLTIFTAGLWGIFEKAGKKGWKALIPGYNLVVLLNIIGLPWWSVFFLLIPIIPWIIVASELGACFKKTKTWSFFLLIPFFFIGVPILGFGDTKFNPPLNIARTERVFTKFLKFALYFAIILLINIIGVQLFFRFDLTDIGVYSLSKASKQAVATLQEPLTVRAFFSDDLPAEYLDLHQYVEDLFQEYAVYGGKNFNFRFYDVGGEGELNPQEEVNREMAQDYGINPIKIQIYKNDSFIYREAYMGMAIIHGDVIETLTQVTSKERLEYNITTTIQKMNNKISALLSLEDKIKVKLFLSSDFFSVITSLADTPDQIEGIVETLNKENYNKLEYIHIDTSKQPQLLPEDVALNPKYFLAGTKEDGASIKLYADLIIQYKDKIEKYNFLELLNTPWGLQPQLADKDTLKEVISETVTNIIDINEYIGYIADHGSVRLQWDDRELQALAQAKPNTNIPKITANHFNEVLSENYSVKEINLSQDERIPKGIECLVIAGPRDHFSDWELFQIDQFLMQGKSLAVFLDGLIEVEQEGGNMYYGMPTPKSYPPTDSGIEFLLEHYGATVKSSYVYDENCLTQPNQTYGTLKIYFIPEIQTKFMNDRLPFMRNIQGLIMIQASPIKLIEEKLKENNIKADILFSSSKQAWEISENINLDNPTGVFPPPADEMQSYPLAVTLEGEFTSFFKGKPIPQKPKKEMEESESEELDSNYLTDAEVTDEMSVIEKAQSPGRIFLVGTSEIIRDLILNYVPPTSLRNTSPNKIFLSNVIDYCNGKEDYAAMRSKLQLVNPLDETKTTPLAKDFTEYFNLIGLPIIAIICGIIVLLMRVARRKQIMLRYSPKGAAAMVSTEESTPEQTKKPSITSKGLQFKKDYLALVIIVGLLLGVLLWSNISRQMGVIQYKLPTLELVQEDSINKIVYTQNNTSITLEKNSNDKWRIMPEGYPVDPEQTASMLEYITDLKITELISKQKQYDRYELDENRRINLKAFSGTTLVRQLDIGKASSTSSHTYVTISDDPNIYSVKGDLKSLFEKDISELRDKQILSFSKEEISEIILEFEGQTVIMGKQMITPEDGDKTAAKEVWMTDISDKPVPENAVNDILTTMSSLVCEEFSTDKQKSDLEAEPFNYKITARGTKDYILTMFDDSGDNKYPAYSSESDYAFNLIGWRATKMMKKIDDLSEKED